MTRLDEVTGIIRRNETYSRCSAADVDLHLGACWSVQIRGCHCFYFFRRQVYSLGYYERPQAVDCIIYQYEGRTRP